MVRNLTDDEILELRAFSRQVDRIRQSSIIKQRKLTVSYTTNFDFTSGLITTAFKGYDEELFQSQLPIFRQFVLKDPVSFNHIHNLVNQCCDRPELVGWVRYAREEWHKQLAWLPGEVHRQIHQATETVDDALEKLFYGYGGLFHVNLHETEEDEPVRAIQNGMLHQAFPYLFRCLNIVDSVIHWWLDAPDEPVPPFQPGTESTQAK